MGKKKHKKEIRKAFKDWDDITPEDQMKNADEFYNISTNTVEDIIGLGVSKKTLIDKETGLESDIIKDILSKHSNTDEVTLDTDKLYPKEDIDNEIESSLDTSDEEESSDEVYDTESNDTLVQNVLNAFESNITQEHVVDTSEPEIAINLGYIADDAQQLNMIEDNTVVNDEEDFDEIRKFGAIVRSELGVVNFNDGISTFSINEFESMVSGLADDIDLDSLPDGIIDLFKKALIVYRYPAAMYTIDEFVSLNLLEKGKLVQGDNEKVYFVDVDGKYIAVYFVYTAAIDRFNDSIRNILDIDDPELGDPYYNVWFDLATNLRDPNHSFVDSEETADLFYTSSHNDKDLVRDYIIAKYIDTTSIEDDPDFDIITKTNVINKYEYVINAILDDDDDGDDLLDEPVKPEVVEDVPTQNDVASAYINNATKDDSMVVPVIHKEGKR